MNSKLNLIFIICTIFWSIIPTKSQVASCSYNIKWLEVYTITFKNNSYYACNLNTKDSNENIKISRIIGQHLPGYNDNYVTYLRFNFYHSSDQKHMRQFSPFFCQKFPNLQVIDTLSSLFLKIDDDSLVNCASLRLFRTVDNKLHAVNEYLLYRNPKLLYISLQDNKLNVLPENLFINQNELLELDLHQNELVVIPSNTFKSLKNLEILLLYDNRLDTINSDWFASLQKLKYLSLHINRIKEVPPNVFINLINLNFLHLGQRNNVQLSPLKFYLNSFNGLKNLLAFDISQCKISDLPANIFASLENLNRFSFSSTNLKTIHSDLFGYHRNLTLIYLSFNQINSFDERILDKTAVTMLYMQNNTCSNTISLTRDQIRQNMRQCFNNYQPRSLVSASIIPNEQELIRPQTQPPTRPPINTSSAKTSYYCGQRISGHGNIVGGTQISRGDYPWLATLMTRKGKYFCGGNLVTTLKVITAAHCIQDKHASLPTPSQEIIILLGAFDLDKTVETGRLSHAVQSIHIHPDWNTLTESFDADIAVLVMETEAVLSRFIQPVCLLNSFPNDLASGVVVGYGKSEDVTKIHENIPKILNSQIHNNVYCFQSNRALSRISSGRTFCGGPGNGIGVCSGDSGGGLYVTDGRSFYLRGIVSSSLIGGQYGCDIDTFSVFTDVVKFVEWIKGI